MPVAAAVVGGVATIGGSILSSKSQKKAANRATEAQKESSAEQIALLREQYAQNTANMKPFLESGYGAQAVQMQLLGLKPLTAQQFNSGSGWYIPGTVNYNPNSQPQSQPQMQTGAGGPVGSSNMASGPTPQELAALNSSNRFVRNSAEALLKTKYGSTWNRMPTVTTPPYNPNGIPSQGSVGATNFNATQAGLPAVQQPNRPDNMTPDQVKSWAQEAISGGANADQVRARAGAWGVSI